MGAVYEARQVPLDRRVAIKTLLPEYARDEAMVARFFNEARVLSRLEHPSIVQVSDFGFASDGTAYLAMEYLRGVSLGHRLATRSGSLSVTEALQLAWQVADVLAVAHAQQIVHRDLKPDNLMLVADPVAPGGERVKVLDFGIAKLTLEGDRRGVKTSSSQLLGTPSYMSPEQCRGAGGVDSKSDVYSLGCVLYQMLAGCPPFWGEGVGEVIAKHLYEDPVPLALLAPNVPVGCCELVHRLLSKDKQLRPTMSETAVALCMLLSPAAGVGPSSQPAADRGSMQTRSGPRRSSGLRAQSASQHDGILRWRRPLIAGTAAAALLAIVASVRARQLSIQSLAGPTQAPGRDPLHQDSSPADRTAAHPGPISEPSAPSSRSAPAPLVIWEIETVPKGATVTRARDRRVLGQTPWLLSQPATATTEALVLSLPKHAPQTVVLDQRVSIKLLRNLEKRPASLRTKPAQTPREQGTQGTEHEKFTFTREE